MHPSSIWNIIRDHSDPFPMNWAWFTIFLFVRMIRTESLMRILDRQSSEIESHTSQMRLRYVVDTWEHAWIYFGIVDLLDQGVFTITIPYVWYVRARIENRSKFMEYGPRPSRNIRKLSVAVIWLLWSGNRPRYRSDSDPNRFFSRFGNFLTTYARNPPSRTLSWHSTPTIIPGIDVFYFTWAGDKILYKNIEKQKS